MSSSDLADRPAETLAHAVDALTTALGDPDRVADEDLRALLAGAVRLYAVKATTGMRVPLPPNAGGVTVDDAMMVATDLLHTLNVQLFELGMWQAMTGNCIAPHHRIDAPQSR
jgi:hypothetical protein